TEDIQLDFTVESVALPQNKVSSFTLSASFHITVYYIGQEVLRREIMGNDVRIAYLPPSPLPPSHSSRNSPLFPRVPLPDPPSDISADPSFAPRLKDLKELLPYMAHGVLLGSSPKGVFAQRFSKGRVFWRSPHCTSTGPCKIERAAAPMLLFSREVFNQERLVKETCVISLPWAEAQIEDVKAFKESIAILKNLANQSPTGEVTLSFVEVSVPSVTNL
ncbi:hypothetical protein DNTS_017799, partial [Danionella cerebrum]